MKEISQLIDCQSVKKFYTHTSTLFLLDSSDWCRFFRMFIVLWSKWRAACCRWQNLVFVWTPFCNPLYHFYPKTAQERWTEKKIKIDRKNVYIAITHRVVIRHKCINKSHSTTWSCHLDATASIPNDLFAVRLH